MALMLLAACSLPLDLLPAVTALPAPTEAATPAWTEIADGLQWRRLNPNGDELAQLIIVRVDPGKYRFRALYRAGRPEWLSGWRERAPAASVIVNANFFDEDDSALGLIVSDGEAYGSAYRNRGGTFLIRKGEPAIVANRSADPPLGGIEQAVQGFPLLVENGAQAYFARASGERTRRTLIAIDKESHVLIMVAPFLGLSLGDLGAYLPATDLAIESALNLDGGRSTMIAIAEADYALPSFDAAPAVLALFPKSDG